MRSPLSVTSTSNGAEIVSHPPTGPETFASENITDEVPPAVTLTVRSADPAALVTGDFVLVRRQIGNGERGGSALLTVDGDARAGRIGRDGHPA